MSRYDEEKFIGAAAAGGDNTRSLGGAKSKLVRDGKQEVTAQTKDELIEYTWDGSGIHCDTPLEEFIAAIKSSGDSPRTFKLRISHWSVQAENLKIGGSTSNLQTLADELKESKAVVELYFGSFFNDNHHVPGYPPSIEGLNILFGALKENNTLKVLDLQGLDIGDDGACILADALEHNSTLRTLILKKNSLGCRGAARLAKALTLNITLKVLDLNRNQIGRDGILSLADMLRVNTGLRMLGLEENPYLDDTGAESMFEALGGNSTLLEFRPPQMDVVNPKKVAAISGMVEKNTTLQICCVFLTGIGDAGVSTLVAAFKKNPASKLKELNLHSSSTTARGIRVLADWLKTNPAIETLILSNTPISDGSADDLAAMLQANTTLKQVSATSCGITDHGVTVIAGTLGKNNIEVLNLGFNSFELVGAQALGAALSKETRLRDLSLSSVHLPPAAIKVIFERLKRHATLKKLDMSSCTNLRTLSPDEEDQLFQDCIRLLRANTVLTTVKADFAAKHLEGLNKILGRNRALECLRSITQAGAERDRRKGEYDTVSLISEHFRNLEVQSLMPQLFPDVHLEGASKKPLASCYGGPAMLWQSPCTERRGSVNVNRSKFMVDYIVPRSFIAEKLKELGRIQEGLEQMPEENVRALCKQPDLHLLLLTSFNSDNDGILFGTLEGLLEASRTGEDKVDGRVLSM